VCYVIQRFVCGMSRDCSSEVEAEHLHDSEQQSDVKCSFCSSLLFVCCCSVGVSTVVFKIGDFAPMGAS